MRKYENLLAENQQEIDDLKSDLQRANEMFEEAMEERDDLSKELEQKVLKIQNLEDLVEEMKVLFFKTN